MNIRLSLMIFAAVLSAVVRMSEATISETVTVPTEKYTAYIVPEPGTDLELIIVPVVCRKIVSSTILAQDTSDTVIWKRDEKTSTPAQHVYKTYRNGVADEIAPVLSSREWVWIHGILRPSCPGGAGPGPVPLEEFNVDVPGVDIDIYDLLKRGQDEEELEESAGGFVCVAGSLKKIVIRKVKPEARFRDAWTQLFIDSAKVKVWTSPAKTTQITSGHKFTAAELPRDLWVEGVAASDDARDVQLRAYYKTPPLKAMPTEDKVRFTVLKVDLNIWNGGSDLDNGQDPGPQGSQVADADEESVGSYLLVNWDDDDADGTMNADGTWSALPVPDLTENSVANEDNLAKLKPAVQPLLDTGTIELEVSGTDAGRVKLWTQSTKGTPVTLTSNKKTWNLANSTEKADFQNFMNNGYWIEGADVGTAERGVTFTLRYKDSGGTEVCNDVCKATVVKINLANAVYRDNMLDLWGIGQNSRGHDALVWRYAGTCTKTDLTNDANFILIEMDGPTDNRNLTTITQQQGYPAYGCFRNPSITYVQRLRILAAAHALVQRANAIELIASDAVLPANWNGSLDTITYLRCDGLVEVCYEVNGVDVWGMERDPDNHTVHYDIHDQADNWTYSPTWGTWSAGANNQPDNLEEHNDFDLVGWADTLMPATQCGNVAPVEADTQLGEQNLCQPIGSTGGN